MEYNEIEEYKEYDEYYDESEEYEEEQEISLDEESIRVRNGKLQFKLVNHSRRAEKFDRSSDGNTTKYVNYALEYFGHRCALSGESFYKFDEKISRKNTNLSSEHVVALAIGGHDIVPNLVPSVLQYNTSKNGYYILDWWPKQEDVNGKKIYSPYRLLKLVNFMMKSIEGRGLPDRKYHKLLMTPNEIDKYLEKVEKEDLEQEDNNKRKIISDTITATTLDEDNNKILTKIPKTEGNIADQVEDEIKRKEYNTREMMDTFLIDAVRMIQQEKEISQQEIEDKNGNKITIENVLDQMLEKTIGKIPFEINVRNKILEKLEEIGIENNKYTISNVLIKNTDILSKARTVEENEIKYIISTFIDSKVKELTDILTEEQVKIAISHIPNLMYEQTAIEKIGFWKAYRSNNIEELLQNGSNSTNILIDVLIVLKNNGINLSEIKFISKINDIIENTPNKDEILEKLQIISNNITEEWPIGDKLNTQKSNNIEKFKQKLENCKIELTDFEYKRLVEEIRGKKNDEFAEILLILKQNGIDLTQIKQNIEIGQLLKDNKNKEIILKQLTNISKDIFVKGEQWNIGRRLNTVKNRSIENFKETVIKVFNDKNFELSEKELQFLTKKEKNTEKSERLLREFVEILIILKQKGVDLTKIRSENKLSDLLENNSNKEQILNELEEISQEIYEKGEFFNIGETLYRKKNNNMFIEILNNYDFTDSEIKYLTEIENNEQQSERKTKELVKILLILKQNDIDITLIKQGRNASAIKDLLENNLNKEDILKQLQEVSNEVDENWNIGQRLNWQKYYKMNEFKEVLENESNTNNIELTKFEENFLLEKIDKYLESEKITEEFVQVLIVLKKNGIDLTKIKQGKNFKISNLLENNSNKEEILENLKNISEEIDESWSIGTRLNKQKNRNIDKLKELIISSSVDFTESEIIHLTEKKVKDKLKEVIVEQKNNSGLGENQKVQADFEQVIKKVEKEHQNYTL